MRAAGASTGRAHMLAGVDLAVHRGEPVAIAGPSGAGKTTLLRLLGGSLRASSGEVEFEGRALAQLRPRELRAVRARVGFVHQERTLVPNLRVSQNVLAGRLGQSGLWSSIVSMVRPARSELEQVHALLERVGIGDKLFQRTDTLSGGEQQRVAVARALYQAPTALLADEPVASVDPERARETVRMFVELAAERELTLVVSLHDISLAREFFPRIIGLRSGRVRFDRPAHELGDDDFRGLYTLDPSGANA